MVTHFKIISGLILLLALPLSSGAQHSSKGMLSIAFNHYVGDKPLNLDSTLYTNELKQKYSITKFKYYIGNIKLLKADGKEFNVPGYFLIDEERDESKKILLASIPDGTYTEIRFIVGVDSLHNCNGAQSGALDPANGMYWAWNTGYIFLKLEGKSSSSTSPGGIFEYHIGGYKQASNCIRTVDLQPAQPFRIEKGKTTFAELKADASEVLRSPSAIDFSNLPAVTDFHNATTIADNYKDMFSIIEIRNEK